MTVADPDESARRLATASLADDDPTGWFERLYVAAAEGAAIVPWDRGHPNRMLVEWAESARPQGRGRRAIVVGCGLGEDAEYVAGFGFETVAFDISATAVHTARGRFSDSTVDYVTADLLDFPSAWTQGFDLVVESLTVQSLPIAAHETAIANIARLVAPGGTLVVIAAGRSEGEPTDGPPWPLTRAEVEAFASGGMAVVRLDDVRDVDQPTFGRWRVELRRPD